MAKGNWRNRLARAFTKEEGDATRRPDGGTSCYRPMRRRMPGEIPASQDGEYGQPIPYVHTGFTGMTPPAGYGYDATGYSQEPVYEQPAHHQPAYDRQDVYIQDPYPQQTAYGSPTAFTQPAPGQAAYFRTQPEPAERAAARPERGWFPPREEAKPQNNISYMPGYAPETATTWSHVEHIMIMTGLKSCYEAIEGMKNGETLIVIMDAIANEGESMRCQDMLAGAAFTLGCSVRTLQGGRLVLIAPEGVRILPEQQAVRTDRPPVYTPVSMPASAPQAATEQPAGRRERRTGNRAEEWKAARSGQMENYHPYTGTMPVAAGSYGSFGGYGY